MNNAIIINKDELNKALLKVLTSKFKKDCSDEYKLVQSAGYTIEKWSGSFHIENPQTHKHITISYEPNGWAYKIGSCSYYFFRYGNHTRRVFTTADLGKIDFVNCLATPVNMAFIEARDYANRFGAQNYASKISKLRDAKWCKRYAERAVEEKKAMIERLQRELEEAIIDREKQNAKYNETLKELGLRK